MGVRYVPSAKAAPCYLVPATAIHPRAVYHVDKTRTLLLTTAMIKLDRLRFFDFDSESQEQRGLLSDFLSLYQEKVDTMRAGEIYVIRRNESNTDDFAQAVNIGCVACWHMHKAWPNLAALAEMILPPEQAQAAITPLTQQQVDAISPGGTLG